tara:strand:+ start:732 stop:1034 length:303 start_codon:yes stop_codon:yes gene_type:complete
LKKINLFIIFSLLFLVSCGNVGKILRNEKIKTTDEFLVKKKEPLVIPPDIQSIPKPGSINKIISNDKDVLKEILNKNNRESTRTNNSSSVEDSILKRLPK